LRRKGQRRQEKDKSKIMSSKKGVLSTRKQTGPIPHEQKIAAAKEYYITGKLSKAAEAGNIASHTVAKWRDNDPDFMRVLEVMRGENEDLFRAEATKTIHTGMKELQDRLEHGELKTAKIEYGEDEDGNATAEAVMYREPVSAKNITYATGIMIDKLRVSNNQPTRITANQDQADFLKQFVAIAEAHMPKEVVANPVVLEVPKTN